MNSLRTRGSVLMAGTCLNSSRAFSTSRAAQLDLSSLYSKLTSWRRKSPANQVVDPTQAEDSKRSDTSMQQGKPRKLQILGKPQNVEEDWESVREFAEFKAWPTRHYRKDLTLSEIESVLNTVGTVNFADIHARFDAIKQVSSSLQIAIPDAVLSKLSTADALKEHLLRSARPFDERQPDAIYLNPEDFVGTNITISDPVAERKAQKKRLHNLVKDSRAAQKSHTDKLLQSS